MASPRAQLVSTLLVNTWKLIVKIVSIRRRYRVFHFEGRPSVFLIWITEMHFRRFVFVSLVFNLIAYAICLRTFAFLQKNKNKTQGGDATKMVSGVGVQPTQDA